MIRAWFLLVGSLRRPRILAGVLVALLLSAVGSWFVLSHLQAARCLRQAKEADENDDFASARRDLEHYLVLRPGDGEGHFLLSRACRRARVADFDHAREHLNEARRLGWSSQDCSLESLLLEFQETGGPQEIQHSLEQFVAVHQPHDALVFEALVRGNLQANDLEGAKRWVNAWVKRYPEDWYARLWRGNLFEYENKANLAVADFQKVLEKRPDCGEARLHLAFMLAQSGYDYEGALRYLEEVRQTHPDDPDLLVTIASCHRVLRQFEPARLLLEKVLGQHPEDTGALLERALIARDQGDDKDTLRWLQRLEPLARVSKHDEHLKRLQRREPVPNSMDLPNQVRLVYHLLAGTLRRSGRDLEAEVYERRVEQLTTDLKALTKTIEKGRARPNDPDLLYQLGILYLRCEMRFEGEHALRQVLKLRPEDRPAHEALALFYRSRPDPESQRRAQNHARHAKEKP